MCDCNYVYVVVGITSGMIVGNRIFDTWAKADAFRNNCGRHAALYKVESLEVE